jgi:uncharacterized membrane protein
MIVAIFLGSVGIVSLLLSIATLLIIAKVFFLSNCLKGTVSWAAISHIIIPNE